LASEHHIHRLGRSRLPSLPSSHACPGVDWDYNDLSSRFRPRDANHNPGVPEPLTLSLVGMGLLGALRVCAAPRRPDSFDIGCEERRREAPFLLLQVVAQSAANRPARLARQQFDRAQRARALCRIALN